MKKLPIAIFIIVITSALFTSVYNYCKAENRIGNDADNALRLALEEMPCDVVNADTIRCYRNHLTIAELRNTACIIVRTVSRDGRQETEMVAEAKCDFITVLMMSDKRESVTLLLVGLIWLAGSMWYMRRCKPELLVEGISYGGIIFANNKFLTSKGEHIRFTPMLHTLLEMFMNTENHSLSKQEICDRLWPKKPDANDTLYTFGLFLMSGKGSTFTHFETDIFSFRRIVLVPIITLLYGLLAGDCRDTISWRLLMPSKNKIKR